MASPTQDRKPRWVFGGTADLMVYANFAGWLRTDLGRTLVPALLALGQEVLAPKQMDCLNELGSAAREFVVGARGREPAEHLILFRFEQSRMKMDPADCLALILSSPVRTAMPGVAQAYADGPDLVVLQPDMLTLGSPELVKRSMRRPQGTALTLLALSADQYLAWEVDWPEPRISGHGGLFAAPERFRFDGELRYASEEIPRRLESQLERQRLVELLGAPGLESLERLARAWDVKRTGTAVSFAFELHEPAVDQARDIVALAALGIAAARKNPSQK